MARIKIKSFKNFLIEMSQPTEKKQCDINGICKIIKTYESAGNEQKILSVYKDSKGLNTIGHGHLVTNQSPKIFSELNINPDILKGKGKLTPEQADKLLQRDVTVRIPEVEKRLPNLSNYSPSLQGELVSEYFRGMLGQSPKTLKLINQGEFEKASDEFLNAEEYRTESAKKSGVATRMLNLANTLKKEASLRKPQKSGLQTTQVPVNSSTSQSAPSR